MTRTTMNRRRMVILLFAAIVCIALFGAWHVLKPLPAGLDMRGMERPVTADRISFLADLTSTDHEGKTVSRQQIFPALFELIAQAREYILVDIFLFNDQPGHRSGTPPAPLAGPLVDRLIARKRQMPGLTVDVITDPINSAYGGAPARELERLRAAGINVIVTDLDPLRDSNPLYSTGWRLLLRWIPDIGRFLPHPFAADGEKVSLNSWLRLINFKANHRKVAVADRNGDLVALVSSANAHGASHDHSNVALLVDDSRVAADIYRSERAVAELSGGQLRPLPSVDVTNDSNKEGADLSVRVLTEEQIREAVCTTLKRAGKGDRVRLAMFYLADRPVIEALLAAGRRGARVELILDPNRDAFGYEKNGVPNRPAAAELVEKSAGQIAVRWYLTHGEQFHSKLLLVEYVDGEATLILGSANFTRRNIGGFNLETDLLVSGTLAAPLFVSMDNYFNRIWHNFEAEYSCDYSRFADSSSWKTLQYRIQESTGLGTF